MDQVFGLLVFISLNAVTLAEEYCYTDEGYQWCENGCCGSSSHSGHGHSYHCCTFEPIIGLIMGGIVFLLGIVGIIVFLCYYKKMAARRRVGTQGAQTWTTGTSANPGGLSNNYGFQQPPPLPPPPPPPPPPYPAQGSKMASYSAYPPPQPTQF